LRAYFVRRDTELVSWIASAAPQSELRLRKMKGVPEAKNQRAIESNEIVRGYRHFSSLLEEWTIAGDGAAAANRRAPVIRI